MPGVVVTNEALSTLESLCNRLNALNAELIRLKKQKAIVQAKIDEWKITNIRDKKCLE